MKKILLHISFLLACMFTWSQSNLDPPAIPLGESCRILSDRSIYVAGEDIRFSLFYRQPEGAEANDWSKVLYAELVSSSGDAYSRTKIKVDDPGTGGVLEIPADLPSGTYFLKGYTKWMKNYGPSSYTYLSVDVVNPHVKTVLLPDTLQENVIPLVQEFESSIPGPVQTEMVRETVKRIPVRMSLKAEKPTLPLEACITVVRPGSLGKQWKSSVGDGHTVPGDWENIPETRGISISGRVEEDSSGAPVSFAVVYISLMGEEKGFFCNYSDAEGRFFLTVPESYLKQDLYIAAYQRETDKLKISIDQDFCLEPLHLPSLPLEIKNEHEELIRNMVVNAQIRDQYTGSSDIHEFIRESGDGYFYGEPTSVIRFDDFIRLPNMQEYISEVIPQISIQRSKKRLSFKVQGKHPDLNHFTPLVLVDGVAIFDVEAVLDISPSYIDRIEIVEAPFIRGNLTFGGIIHLISRNGNMAYIDLPSSGLLVNYSMFDKGFQGHPAFQPENPRIPDVRNTLYWNPHIRIMPGKTETIQFYTPDQSGSYEVVVRGFDSDGSYFENTFPFRVD